MAYAVQVVDRNATITESEEGRYPSALLAVKAAIRAAKDTDINTITVNGISHNITDAFTGGLLRDSQIILMTTGVVEPEPSLLTRVINALFLMLSTWLADRSFRAKTRSPRVKVHHLSIYNANIYGPFDARLAPLNTRARERRHRHK